MKEMLGQMTAVELMYWKAYHSDLKKVEKQAAQDAKLDAYFRRNAK